VGGFVDGHGQAERGPEVNKPTASFRPDIGMLSTRGVAFSWSEVKPHSGPVSGHAVLCVTSRHHLCLIPELKMMPRLDRPDDMPYDEWRKLEAEWSRAAAEDYQNRQWAIMEKIGAKWWAYLPKIPAFAPQHFHENYGTPEDGKKWVDVYQEGDSILDEIWRHDPDFGVVNLACFNESGLISELLTALKDARGAFRNEGQYVTEERLEAWDTVIKKTEEERFQ
jgi:hypothetical protein